MSKAPEPKMTTARPASRIRREPPPTEKPQSLEKALWRPTREWEIALALIGIVLFALAINAAWVGISAISS